MLNCKKAEIGETMTWIVGSVIIIVILIIFLYAASAFGTLKSAQVQASKFAGALSMGSDLKIQKWMYFKSIQALKINQANKDTITKWIGEENPDQLEVDLQYGVAG
jgi:hypothetical protein